MKSALPVGFYEFADSLAEPNRFNNLKRVVMKSLKVLALGLMMTTGVVNAAVTSTLTAATDYNLRGISQNAKGPVLQASLEVSGESGLYLGAFLSSVSFDGQKLGTEYFRLERDVYAGYRLKASDAVSLDFGGKFYTYNSNALNHGEVYAALTYKSFVKGSAYYSPNFINGNSAISKPAYGVALDASKDLPANFSLLAHAGYNTGEYWTDSAFKGAYIDYSVGAGYKMGNFNWALQYVDTAKGTKVAADEMNSSSRMVLSVTTKLPW